MKTRVLPSCIEERMDRIIPNFSKRMWWGDVIPQLYHANLEGSLKNSLNNPQPTIFHHLKPSAVKLHQTTNRNGLACDLGLLASFESESGAPFPEEIWVKSSEAQVHCLYWVFMSFFSNCPPAIVQSYSQSCSPDQAKKQSVQNCQIFARQKCHRIKQRLVYFHL